MSNLPFAPDWISHPGLSISDRMEELKISEIEMAEKLDVTLEEINSLMAGFGRITPERASRISLVLGSTPSFWIDLQAHHDSEVLRLKSDEEISAFETSIKESNVHDLFAIPAYVNHGHRITMIYRKSSVLESTCYYYEIGWVKDGNWQGCQDAGTNFKSAIAFRKRLIDAIKSDPQSFNLFEEDDLET